MGSHKLTTRAERLAPPAHNPYNEKCGAKKTDGSGDTCGHNAGYGTDHEGVGACKHHGGSTDAGKKRAAVLLAKRTMGQYGVGEVDIEPHEGILWCVRMTAHEIQYITEQCKQCTEVMAHDEEQNDPHHFASKKLQALVQERSKAMDRLARYSKMALDAGVAERQVRIAEGYGHLLALLLKAVFNDLNLSAEQRRMAPMIAQTRLMELESGILDGSARDKELTA